MSFVGPNNLTNAIVIVSKDKPIFASNTELATQRTQQKQRRDRHRF